MKRAALLLLAAGLLPAGARAQMMVPEDSPWGPRLRLTPFVGQAPTVSRSERWSVFVNGSPESSAADVDLGAGPAAGAVLEVQLIERFSFVASGLYISRGRTREFSSLAGQVVDFPGSNFMVARAGLSMRLREPISELQFRRLSASVFAGPAFLRESPQDNPLASPIFQESLNHWGANFGIEAEIPTAWQSLALVAGVEDFVVFWNDAEAARRVDRFAAQDGFVTETVIDTDASHMLVLRAGLSLRFQ